MRHKIRPLQPTVPQQLPPDVVNFPHLEGWATGRSEALPQPQWRYDPPAMVPYANMIGGHSNAPINGLHPVLPAQKTYRHPSAAWPSYSPSADLCTILRKEGVLTPSQHGTAASIVAEAPISTAVGAATPGFQLPLRSLPTFLPEEPVPPPANAESTAIQLAATRTPPLSDGTADVQANAQNERSTAPILPVLSDSRGPTPEAENYFQDLVTGMEPVDFEEVVYTIEDMEELMAANQDVDYSHLFEAFDSKTYATPEDEVVAMIPPNNKTHYPSTQLLRDCAEAADPNDESDLAVTARYAREPRNLAYAFTVGHVDHVLELVYGDGWNGDS